MRRHLFLLALSLLAACSPLPVPSAITAPAAQTQAATPRREEDEYSRYELLEPGSARFRILFEVTTTEPGATVPAGGSVRLRISETLHRPEELSAGGGRARLRPHPGPSEERRRPPRRLAPDRQLDPGAGLRDGGRADPTGLHQSPAG